MVQASNNSYKRVHNCYSSERSRVEEYWAKKE